MSSSLKSTILLYLIQKNDCRACPERFSHRCMQLTAYSPLQSGVGICLLYGWVGCTATHHCEVQCHLLLHGYRYRYRYQSPGPSSHPKFNVWIISIVPPFEVRTTPPIKVKYPLIVKYYLKYPLIVKYYLKRKGI